MKPFPKKVSLPVYALAIAVYTVAAFHIPFFKHALSCMEGGWNSVLLTLSAALLLVALDFLVCYYLVALGRFVGKCVVSFFLVGNGLALYFINDYHIVITDAMMAATFNTQYSEAAGFFSPGFFLYPLLLGGLPSIYVFARKIEYGSWKRFLAVSGISLAVLVGVVFGNMKNWPWIDRNSTELGGLTLPWSYIANSIRYKSAEKSRNVQEILLDDVEAMSASSKVCVLIIGESARRDHFSLYGYDKLTNPYTAADSVVALPARAAATNTLDAVKALLQPFPSSQLYEILPNYLLRAGVDVTWRTGNWGEPPVKTQKYYTKDALHQRFPDVPVHYDGILLEGLRADLEATTARKVFVVIHTYTNHGPSYNTNYPPQFEHFTPVCNTVEMSQTSPEELLNAYDNSIVYADYLTHSVIETVRSLPGRRGCVIYVSDHGESLGEGGLYMHGVPMAIAPREQIEIPFVVWTSDKHLKVRKDLGEVSQYHVYHSVLRFLGLDTPVYNPDLDIFETPAAP